jgi:ribosomal protein S18 acetylase RimI-like enzyme
VAEKWLISWCPSTDQGAQALLAGRGYEVVRRYHEMVRPTMDAIGDSPVPDGLRLQVGRFEEARPVFDAAAEAFRDHWGERDESEEAFRRFITDPLSPPELWVVAWDGDEIAGVVTNKLDAPDEDGSGGRLGTLDSVSVRRPWRRRGLGRAMVAESLRLLRDAGATRATLGVDTDNQQRALDLYTGAGFEPVNTELEFRRRFEA